MIFVIMRVLPGDPLIAFLDPNQMRVLTEEEIALIKETLGLDRPYVVQYADWMGDVLTGSFGKSLFGTKAPVIDVIRSRGVGKRRDWDNRGCNFMAHRPARGHIKRHKAGLCSGYGDQLLDGVAPGDTRVLAGSADLAFNGHLLGLFSSLGRRAPVGRPVD